MRIAVDARELQGNPTGVGRFLGELLAIWETLPEAQAHEFILLTPEGVERGTVWEQLDLPRLYCYPSSPSRVVAPAHSDPTRAHASLTA